MRRPLLLVAVCLLAVAAPAAGINPYDRKQAVDEELSQLREKIAAIQGREDELRAEISAVTSEIRVLERRIGRVEERLEPLQRDLELHQRRLEALGELFRLQSQRLRFLRREYAAAVEHLNRRLVALYETDAPGTLEVILSARSFTEILDQLDFVKLVAEQDRRIAREVERAKTDTRRARARTKATRRRVATVTRVIEARAAQVRDVRDRLAASHSELDEARSEKRVSLDTLSAEEREAAEEAEALAKVSSQLAAKILAAQTGRTVAAAPPSAVSSAGLIWPVSAPLTSPFGWRWGRMHEGIDLGAGYGTPIRAASSGTVIHAGWLGGYGNLVIIDHGGSISTAYGHQSSIAVGTGQSVSQGQVIGYVGSTGHSTGPHLHFEVRVNGGAVDPLGYL
ncbi:MAG: murein hydrolase activator EnvC [Gaiellaceae bacterium]